MFLHLFLYWWATVYILLSISNKKKAFENIKSQLKRIEREVKKPKRSTILNKITISKSMIKSTVFAKHIRGKNWFDDEVT